MSGKDFEAQLKRYGMALDGITDDEIHAGILT